MPILLAATVAFSTLAFWFEGVAAIVYLALYVLAFLPGLPIGWRIFGRDQPLGWIAGALCGYALSAIAFWIPAWLSAPHLASFGFAWLAMTVTVWTLCAPRNGQLPLALLPRWSVGDTRWWFALVIIVAAFVVLPLSRVGETDESGARRYRAYFTADFVWHMAMTQELARFELPVTNPYLAPEPIHYYWTYFMVPAVIAGPESAPLVSTETALKITAIGTALLMFSVIFLSAHAVSGGRRVAVFAACLIALTAPSWEGLYTLHRYWSNGLSLAEMGQEVRGLNIDAVTNWQFQGLRIDGLVRSMWWTPQHATSFTLGLIALVVVAMGTWPRAVDETSAGPARAANRNVMAMAGLFLALSVAMNPLLGAAFCAIHGLVVIGAILRRHLPPRALVDQVFTVIPVAIALGWTVLNHMGGGSGDAITIGWVGLGRNAPVTTLVLSIGGLLIPAVLALWPGRAVPLGAAWVAIPAFAVALCLAWFVSITDIAWIGFRAGNVFQITLPMLAAIGLARVGNWSRRAMWGLVIPIVVIGAPTTLIDTFNAQDVNNRTMGPGFRWTIPISPDQQAGLRWIKLNTPSDSIVQADPIPRGRDQWSLIPSFAGRRSAAGEPISLLATPAYAERSRAVHELLLAPDAGAAYQAAGQLGLDYIWLDDTDDAAIAERFRGRPDLFAMTFRRGAVHVFEVRRP